MLHLYYGTGKGKTSAAIGLALRMRGAGKSVLWISFLKDGNSSEVSLLEQVGIKVIYKKMPEMFVDMNDPNMIKEVGTLQRDLFHQIDEDYDAIILDELLDVITLHLINEERVFSKINTLKDTKEIIMTGRQPTQKFKQISEYSTEMKKHKHPYDKGIHARKGIEY
ncbi:MAG: cob(I)yrinic acid a,c-diamide adenosyltransferase [Coprobacillaceae bacterium]